MASKFPNESNHPVDTSFEEELFSMSEPEKPSPLEAEPFIPIHHSEDLPDLEEPRNLNPIHHATVLTEPMHPKSLNPNHHATVLTELKKPKPFIPIHHSEDLPDLEEPRNLNPIHHATVLTEPMHPKSLNPNHHATVLTELKKPKPLDPIHHMQVLAELRESLGSMYKQEVLTDLQVQVQGQVFQCHQVVLAAMSGYFQSLLLSGMQESENGEVELKDVSKEAFHNVLQYVYCGEDVVVEETVEELLKAAVLLQINALEKHCVEFLLPRISAANCIGTWRLGKDYGCSRLVKTSWSLLLSKFDEVVCVDEFRLLEKDDLLSILEDPQLNTADEDSICKAVLGWTKGSLASREQYLDQLLDFICLPKVSDALMFDLVADQEFLQRNDRYKESVMEALRYHLKPDERPTIMARQVCFRNDPNFQKVAVLIGGYYVQEDPLRTMLCLDLNTQKWYAVASVPHDPGEDFATCVHKNEIYLSGGSRNLDKFVKYNPVTNDWIAQPCLTTGRECHAMVEVGGSIYLVGGQNSAANHPVEDIDAYNIEAGTWSNVGKLEYPLESLSAVAMGTKIYTFGGMDEFGKTSSAIQCFDTTNGECILVGSLPNPTALPLGVAFNSNVYILCCEGTVYRFDQTQTVSKVADFDARSKFGLYAEGSKLTLVGGEKDAGLLTDELLQVDVHSGSVTQSPVKLTIPFSGFKMELLVVPRSLLVQEGFNVQGQAFFNPEFEFMQQKRHVKKKSFKFKFGLGELQQH